MWTQDARERILDRDAICPAQFTVSQREWLNGRQPLGRMDPTPADWHMATLTRGHDGLATYADLYPDDDCWRQGDDDFGSLYAAEKPT